MKKKNASTKAQSLALRPYNKITPRLRFDFPAAEGALAKGADRWTMSAVKRTILIDCIVETSTASVVGCSQCEIVREPKAAIDILKRIVCLKKTSIFSNSKKQRLLENLTRVMVET